MFYFEESKIVGQRPTITGVLKCEEGKLLDSNQDKFELKRYATTNSRTNKTTVIFILFDYVIFLLPCTIIK